MTEETQNKIEWLDGIHTTDFIRWCETKGKDCTEEEHFLQYLEEKWNNEVLQ